MFVVVRLRSRLNGATCRESLPRRDDLLWMMEWILSNPSMLLESMRTNREKEMDKDWPSDLAMMSKDSKMDLLFLMA